MKPNIIFLDIDGVLVNPETCIAEGERGGFGYFDPVSCKLVKRLCEEHNCKLVISSSWRILTDMWQMYTILQAVCPSLGTYMFLDDRWRTDSLDSHRGGEIKAWIDKHSSEFEKFVIIDDDSDMEPLMDSLVQTDGYQGFRMRDFLKAVEILK